MKVVFTSSRVFIRIGWRSITLDANERYGFSRMPHQNQKRRESRILPMTHHVLLEHGSEGTFLLANVFGELVAKQIVDKLLAVQAGIKKREKAKQGR